MLDGESATPAGGAARSITETSYRPILNDLGVEDALKLWMM